MHIILETSDIHHLFTNMLIQQTIAIDFRLFGNSGDNNKNLCNDGLRMHYVRFQKINIERQVPTILAPLSGKPSGKQTSNHTEQVVKNRIAMYNLTGTYPCNKAYSGHSKDKCGTCHLISPNRTPKYFAKLNLQILGTFSCKSNRIYILNHRLLHAIYIGSTDEMMSTRNAKRRSLIKKRLDNTILNLDDYDNYLLGSTGIIGLDRFLEDAFILLQQDQDQSKFPSQNSKLNIFDRVQVNQQLFEFFQQLNDEGKKMKLMHLYSSVLFFKFLFNLDEVTPR